MTTKTRDDIFLEKLSRLLQENRTHENRTNSGVIPKQSRTPEMTRQRTTTNRRSEDFRNEPLKREA